MHCNGSKPCQVRIKTQHSVRKKVLENRSHINIFHQKQEKATSHAHFILEIYSRIPVLSTLFTIMSQRLLCEYTPQPRSI